MREGVALLESWGARRYVEPRPVPVRVLSAVRTMEAGRRWCGTAITMRVVRVLVDGEHTPRDVAAERVT